jgi:rhamnogalacturonyl hydrolase YesR
VKRLITALLVFSAAAGAATELAVKKTGKSLEIRAKVDAAGDVELRLHSFRNGRISSFREVSPLDPHPRTEWPADRETWYPVVDVELEPGMEGVAMFDPAARSMYAVNGMFYREMKPLGSRVAIPRERLEPWENSLFVETAAARLASFYLRKRIPAASGEIRHVLRLLSEDWSGSVSLHAVDAAGETRELQNARVSGAAPGPEMFFGGEGIEQQRLIRSLAATVDYTLRSQNRDPHSPTRGGLFLFYDLDASVYRSSHWIWGWGPSVKLLLDTAHIPAVASRFGAGGLRRAADEIGKASLRFEIGQKGHPVQGIPVSRWDRSIVFDHGHKEAVTPSDANFLSGWAWVPLYEATKNRAYLDAAIRLAAATDHLSRQFDLIPQNYWRDTETWSNFTLDESGFGAEGLAELYRVTGREEYRELGRRYIEQHLAKLHREDGLWDRMWLRNEGRPAPTLRNTRAAGWAAEGLMASHRMTGDGKYLDLAKRMAEHLMQSQNREGYWTFHFPQPKEEVGIAAKGTALWALLFYRLYDATRDERHLKAARKALQWLMANQYAGPDPEANGSVYDRNQNSAVGYRPWFRVSCTYGSAFFGLAVLEEIRVQRARY